MTIANRTLVGLTIAYGTIGYGTIAYGTTDDVTVAHKTISKVIGADMTIDDVTAANMTVANVTVANGPIANVTIAHMSVARVTVARAAHSSFSALWEARSAGVAEGRLRLSNRSPIILLLICRRPDFRPHNAGPPDVPRRGNVLYCGVGWCPAVLKLEHRGLGVLIVFAVFLAAVLVDVKVLSVTLGPGWKQGIVKAKVAWKAYSKLSLRGMVRLFVIFLSGGTYFYFYY
jgi:hypothetical protein